MKNIKDFDFKTKTVFRFILYARLLYSLILVTYYSNIPQDSVENNSSLDPINEVLNEIGGCMTAVYSICEAANDALSRLFMAALTSDPAWDLGLRKFYFYSSVSNAMIT